ncbi:flavodoxin [Anaerovorax odorimutans]|uniref:flavodoxin n=1 Tax=Anaerovorax odorimutans TaxID=109327 RepID=UPI00040C99D6|nr:flavodoxin [Anaerovorax odorimutans]
MSKIAVVYWSGTGNTREMANSVAEGVKSVGGEVELFTPLEFPAEKINNYDGIAFGCPSMGAEVLEETEFEPMFIKVKPLLNEKPIALFGSYGWGDGEWMRNWEDDCQKSGCNLICDPVIANEMPDDKAKVECKALGETLAKDM